MEHDGATFVTKIEQKEDGQLWLFLTPGANYLYLKHPEAGKVGFEFKRDLGLNLKSKTVYEATVVGDKEWYYQQLKQCHDDSGQAIQSGFLIIKSQPEGAMVYLNGDYAGETPYQVMKPYGTYYYELRKNLYHTAEGQAKIASARTEVNETLRPDHGSIRLQVTPAGKPMVTLDGVELALPADGLLQSVSCGKHQLTVRMDMYKPAQQEVTVSEGQTSQISLEMKPNFGEITLTADAGADIYLNGERKGTGRYTGRLLEGLYEVDVRKPHYRFARQQLQVVAGQDQTIAYELTPIYGSLAVMTTPMDAELFVDGTSYGPTPAMVDRLLEGEHTVELRKAGYATATQKVSIQEQQSSTLELTLQQPSASEQKVAASGQEVCSQVADHNGTNTYTVKGVSFTMVAVKGGTFTMGATSEQGSDAYSDESPTHQVTLSDFAIGETEVTQELWQAVMGYKPTSGGSQWSSSYGLGAQYPAYYVSWNDCQEFISKLNALTGQTFRLPTEAEWEYAARGGSQSKGYKYSGSNTIRRVAWYTSNSSSATHPVKTKAANELGLYDMSGNVWEWCSDWYGFYSSSAQTNPTGASSGSYRVLRGGCWYYNARNCRVSCRGSNAPSYRYYDIGLRLAR